jgi:hypothetical protein
MDLADSLVHVDLLRRGQAVKAEDGEGDREDQTEKRPDFVGFCPVSIESVPSFFHHRTRTVVEVQPGSNFWTRTRVLLASSTLGRAEDDRGRRTTSRKNAGNLTRMIEEDRTTLTVSRARCQADSIYRISMIPPAAYIRPAWVTVSWKLIHETLNWMIPHVKVMAIQP